MRNARFGVIYHDSADKMARWARLADRCDHRGKCSLGGRRDEPPDSAALDAKLTDRWARAHPEHVLTERVEESREAQARRRHGREARRSAAT
jgi:hypothetical protein